MPKFGGRLFADEVVPATTFYRQGKAVLDTALEKPVTITRNDQHFALMRRELAARLAAISDQVTVFTDAMTVVGKVRQKQLLGDDHPLRWLNTFDEEELQDFVEDLVRAMSQVVHSEDAEAVESVIYEWHQSSIVLESEALAAALTDEYDPVPLTPPAKYRQAEDGKQG